MKNSPGMGNDKLLVTRSSMPPYEEYIEAIKPLWESRWLTNMGFYHNKFEDELKKYLDVPEVSLMVNGHMALELTIQAFDFPEGSEVITTPFTFISTTHAITRNGLVPVFCDVKESDGTIDEFKIEALITPKTVAILPVHVYGNVCNVDAIQKIADNHGLKVIYDAAHAFGVKYRNRGIGNYGDASIFSFHATKVFNSIEGGAITFKNHSLYEKLYNLKNFGIRGEEIVETIGANAKMNEFCAIMGLCNLKTIDSDISKRKQLSELYFNRLSSVNGIQMISIQNGVVPNYAYFPVFLYEEKYGKNRDQVVDILKAEDIYVRKYFYPLTNEFECYKNRFGDSHTPVAKKISDRVITLPLYSELELSQVDKICDIILYSKNELGL